MSELKCEGVCNMNDECYGEVKRVHVVSAVYFNHDWGEFNYCDNAISVDRKNKFRVEILDEASESE